MYGRYGRRYTKEDDKYLAIIVTAFCIFVGLILFFAAISGTVKCAKLFKGKDFLPIEAECINSEHRWQHRRGRRGSRKVYDNEFSYEVNGETYTVTFYSEPSPMTGETGTLYYDPNDPEVVSPYRNIADWFMSTGMYLYLFAVLVEGVGLIIVFIFIKHTGITIGKGKEKSVGTVINNDLDFLDNDDYFQNKY